jgi:hypothetical protein
MHDERVKAEADKWEDQLLLCIRVFTAMYDI